jgi:4-amino-4-deoxy-L-arabinose transferase-like glycosyltransferase
MKVIKLEIISRGNLNKLVVMLKSRNILNKMNIVFFLILLLAVFLRVWKFTELPPLWVDEIPNGILASEIIEYGIIKHLFFPKLLAAHEGPILSLVLIPSIYFLGFTTLSLRLPFPIFGVLTIVLTYYVAKNLYNKKIALLTCFFLTIFPSHIYFSRAGFEYIIITFFALLAVFFLNKFLKRKKKEFLYFLSLVSGLGVATRLSFILFLFPFTLLFTKLFKIKLNIKWYDLLICFALLFSGIYPYIFSNLNAEFTVPLLLKYFPKTTEGVNLLDIGGNLLTNFSLTIPQFFKGQFFYLNFNSLFFIIFLFSFVFFLTKLLFKLQFRLDEKYLRADILLVGTIGTISILLSTVTLTTFRHGDYLMLAPFFMIIISKSFFEIFTFVRKYSRKIFYFLILIASILFFYEVHNFFNNFYLSQFQPERITPTSPLFDIICITSADKLANSISQFNYSHILVDDSNVLYFNLRWYGKIPKSKIDAMLYYTEDIQITKQRMIEKLQNAMKDKDVLYVITSNNCLRFGPIHNFYKKINPKAVFFNVLEQNNKTGILKGEILSPSGHVIYEIYQVI